MVCADCDNLTIDFYLASANFRDLGFEEKKQFQKLVNAVMDDLQSGEPQGYFSVPIPIFTFHFRYHESGFCLYDPKTEPGKHLYQPLVRDSPVLIPDGGDEEVGQQQNGGFYQMFNKHCLHFYRRENLIFTNFPFFFQFKLWPKTLRRQWTTGTKSWGSSKMVGFINCLTNIVCIFIAVKS